ncbi:Mucolipin-3, partial [Araneus ventricosus]
PLELTTTTVKEFICQPAEVITTSIGGVISEPVENISTSVTQVISEPVEKTTTTVSRAITETAEKISTTVGQLTGKPIERSTTLVREVISEPVEETTTTIGQVLVTEPVEKVSKSVKQLFGEPIEKSTTLIRQLSSEPIEKTTTIFRQLVTEPTEKSTASVSQLFTEPVVKTTASVGQLTGKFEEKRTSVTRELMSDPARETTTSVAELHLEPTEGSSTPIVQVPSEPIGYIPQSVRPRTVASKKKSGEVKTLGIKEGISQGQPASERTSLLGSSFEIHPGVSYGGIAASFAGHPEAHSSTEFLMSSEGGLVWSEEELKRKLKYFFMNPIEKWRAKGKFPWKLVLQVVKIIFVTVQLCVFGSDGYIYELQKQNTGTSFNHMFLKDWTALRDVVSYPPSTGAYAVYTKPEFYANVDHVVKTYANITNIALGTYCYDGPNCTMTYLSFCRKEFNKMVSFNQSVVFDSHQKTICHKIPDLYPEGDTRWKQFSIQRYLDDQNDTVSFDKMITAMITFSLKTIFLKSLGSNKYPDCYRFDIDVLYNNKEHDGQVLVSLDTKAEKLKCYHNGTMNPEDKWGYILRQVLNCFIIFICILSLLLCCRCLAKGRYLCRETNKYFKFSQNKALNANEKMEFLDMWYCAMIFNDALIIAASILKAAIEQRTVESDQYATCAILLGVGNLLVWAGVLRYLGFFSKYNILILTMKKAIPNVLRFTLCCVLLYAGFCFCGWVVLGPYHIKFRNLSSTSECLFAMMNGDDLFATFAITNTNNDLIWWFSRIYLYTFISMFIYVVISLFISVIMDSYETVKDHYRNGNTMTRIQVLLADIPEDSCSSFYQQRRKQQKTCWQWIITYFRK